MIILIPTYNRLETQTTWESLCSQVRKDVVLVVHPREAAGHRSRGREVLECPVQGKGMARVRSWMLEWCYNHNHRKVFFLDDDLTLQKRREDLRVLGASTPEQQLEMVAWVDRSLNKFAHCAFTERNAAWDDPAEYQLATKGIQAVGYNVTRIVEETDCRFDKGVPDWFFIEDFHMTVQLLKAGLPNIVSRVYRVNFGPSNAAGGCSTHRTPEKLEEAAKLLEKLHPGIVKAVQRETKTSFGGGVRWNVKVMWKKAYESSKNKPSPV